MFDNVFNRSKNFDINCSVCQHPYTLKLKISDCDPRQQDFSQGPIELEEYSCGFCRKMFVIFLQQNGQLTTESRDWVDTLNHMNNRLSTINEMLRIEVSQSEEQSFNIDSEKKVTRLRLQAEQTERNLNQAENSYKQKCQEWRDRYQQQNR
ncbi:MAG: hypothetical protein HRU15_08750 [Planctomycetes bacterium]|nr:hypothetical protein [Planctomycetota bacterium]